MSKDQMNNEIMYKISKELIDKLLRKRIITEDEYRKIDELNLIKFSPEFAQVYG